MVARLYLVRHGESERQGSYCGRRCDPGLSPAGRAQAVLLADVFRAEAPAGIWCSSLLRARSTAEEIARHHDLKVFTDPDLDEMDFGDWDGLTHDQISSRWQSAYSAWLSQPLSRRPPNGESVPEVLERSWSAFASIRDTVRGDRVADGGAGEPHEDRRSAKHSAFRGGATSRSAVIVTHGGPIRLLLASVLQMPLSEYWRFTVNTASITVVDCFDGDAAVLVYSNRDAQSGLPGSRI